MMHLFSSHYWRNLGRGSCWAALLLAAPLVASAANPVLTIVGTGNTSPDVTAFVDQVEIVRVSDGTVVAGAVANPSFETYNPLGNGSYGYNPTGASWTFNNRSGINQNGGGFGAPATPYGSALAFIQSTAGSPNGQIQQTLNLANGVYQVRFQVSQRNCCSSNDQRLNVLVDGLQVGTVQPLNNNTNSVYTTGSFVVGANNALDFDGTDDNVSIPTATAFDLTTALTIEAWIKPVGTGAATQDVICKSSNTQNTGYIFPRTDDNWLNLRLWMFRGGGWGQYTVPYSANIGKWHHVAATYNGTSVVIYIDGVVTPTTTSGTIVSGAIATNTNPLTLGNQPGFAEYYRGGLEDARVYNAVLTQAQIQADMFSTSSALPGNQVAFYNFDQGVAGGNNAGVTTLNDQSGNGRNGTLTNFALTGTTSNWVRSFPTITGISPTSGNVGTSVTITGTNLMDANGFKFNGTAVSPFTTPTGDFSATATAPAATTTGPVSVSSATLAAYNGPVFTRSFVQAYVPVTVSGFTDDVVANGTGPAAGFITNDFDNTAKNGYTLMAQGYRDGNGNTATVGLPATGVLNSITTPGLNFQLASYNANNSLRLTSGSGVLTLATPMAASAVYLLAATGSGSSSLTATVTYTDNSTEVFSGLSAPDWFNGSPATVQGLGRVNVPSSSIANDPSNPRLYELTLTLNAANGSKLVKSVTITDNSSGPVLNVMGVTLNVPLTTTAVSWTGAVSTDWFTAGNWSPAAIPNGGIDVTIPVLGAGNYPLIAANAATANNLTIASGATLSMSGGTLTPQGNFTNNGTFAATGGTAQFGAGSGSTIGGSSLTSFWNLATSGSATGLGTASGIAVQRLLTTGSNLNTNGNPITLLSSATGTALAVNPVSGVGVVGTSGTVQRYISADLNAGLGYRHLSSATVSTSASTGTMVSDLATAGFTPAVNSNYNTSATPGTTVPFPTVFSYDQSRLATAANNLAAFDKGWQSPAALSDRLTSGQGYTVNLAANQTVAFKGQLGSGTFAKSLTRNAGASANGVEAGWQLLGNPYPSPLDYSLVLAGDRTNLDAAMYVFESTTQYGGAYRSYVNGVGGNPILAQGQGFFVRVSSGQTSGTLTLRDDQRVTAYQNPVYHRGTATATDPRPLVQLELRGTSGPADVLYAYAQAGATPAFDAQYDAEKLANSTGLNLSSTATSGQRLAIDGRPVFDAATQLPLNVGVPAAGTYAFAAVALNNLPAGLEAYLLDHQTGQAVNLRQQPTYAFTVTAAQAAALLVGRFSLRFAAGALATAPALTAAQVALYPNPARGAFTLLMPGVAGASAVRAELVNALGQVVRRQAAALPAGGATLTVETGELAAGVYTLRLLAGPVSLAKRVVLQ